MHNCCSSEVVPRAHLAHSYSCSTPHFPPRSFRVPLLLISRDLAARLPPPAISPSSPTVGSRLSALTPTLLLAANPACTPSKPVGGWSPPAKASCSPSVISRLASIAGSLSSKVLFLRCELLLQISNSLLTRHLGTTSRKLIGCSKMAAQHTAGDLKEKLATQEKDL